MLQGLNQEMRQHESTCAAEHLRMMANRNSSLENKVTIATSCRSQNVRSVAHACVCLQVEEVKGELLERYKVLPALSSRLSDLENQNDELRDKNRQMEQKFSTMQVLMFHVFFGLEVKGLNQTVDMMKWWSDFVGMVNVWFLLPQKLMSSHSEKLLEVELELRSLRLLRDEVENLRGTLESVRVRLTALEQGRSGTGPSTHTLGQNA